MKNLLRQPTPILRSDPPRKVKTLTSKPLAEAVPFVGQQISEPQRTLAQIYDRGLFRYTEGHFADACLDFKQSSQDPQQLVSCILMASRCYQRMDRPGKALALLKAAMARKGCLAEEVVLFQQEVEILCPPAVAPLLRVVPPLRPQGEAVPTKAKAEPQPQPQPEAKPTPTVIFEAAPTAKLSTLLFAFMVIAALTAGYMVRGEQHLIAGSGLGYQLGIIGSLLMLALMLYPLRKKASLMRNWGSIPQWFRFHMLAGIIGPVLILFHANFQLGSLNSQVVLGSTLLVAGSGVFGRYLYTRIHYGLYGKRLSLEQLHEAISSNQDNLAAVFLYAPKIKERLLGFDEAVLRPSTGVLQSISRVVAIDLRKRWTHFRIQLVLRRALKVATQRNRWSRSEKKRQYHAANKLISRHLETVLTVAEFSFYERFFSLWHVLHMPLFLVLVVALVLHVIAVHMY